MPILRRVFFGLIIGFMVELAGMILAGQVLGVGVVLLLLVLGAVVGGRLLRNSGGALAGLARNGQKDTEILAKLATKSMLRALAGVLLIFPGFLSDLVAAGLLIPFVSRVVAKWLRRHIPEPRSHSQQGPVIEGESFEVKPEVRANDEPQARG
jgi:UPF0716 protein FxsA